MNDLTTGPDSYQDAVQHLARILVEGRTTRATLEELLVVAQAAAGAVDALTVTAIDDDGGYTSAAWTDTAARDVDELEYRIEEGPCIEALRTGEEQFVRDTEDDDRWPTFAEAARRAGFRTVAGLPLVTAEGVVQGALNVFMHAVDALEDADLALLRRVTTPAGVVLANARAYRRADALSRRLADELQERALWHRAVGVVLGRHEVDPETAERTLERTAHHLGVEPAEVARRVVAGEAVELRSS